MRARASEARGRWFDSSRSLQILNFRGLGNGLTRLAWDQENLGSNPRSPTSFCGVAKWQGNWLLTSLCAGSNPAPTAKNAGVAFWLRAPLLQRDAVEFDPLPRYQSCAPASGG